MAPEAERVFELADPRLVLPIGRVALRDHLERVAEQVDVVDVGAGQVGLQRREHVAHRHAEHLGLVAIDDGVELRIARVEVAEGERDRRIRRRGFRELLHGGLERAVAEPAAVLDHHAEAAGVAEAAHRGGVHDADLRGRDVREPLAAGRR